MPERFWAQGGRPNWGWGERDPVPMFTEDEIRAVMDEHPPVPEWDVGIMCGAHDDGSQLYEDHFIDKLKEARLGCQEKLCSYPQDSGGAPA